MFVSTPARRVARTFLALGLVLPMLAGCAIIEGPTPETPKREAPVKPEVAPEFVPGGSAKKNLPYFTEVLRRYSKGTDPVKGQPIANAVIDAGFDRAAIRFSDDLTKTGLDADNIFISVLIGKQCLIGQVVAEDRSFVASKQPALGPNKDICLIGKTRSVDW